MWQRLGGEQPVGVARGPAPPSTGLFLGSLGMDTLPLLPPPPLLGVVAVLFDTGRAYIRPLRMYPPPPRRRLPSTTRAEPAENQGSHHVGHHAPQLVIARVNAP